MSILDNLTSKFRVDAIGEPSTEESIAQLKLFSPIEVPNDYIDIIRKGTDVEINAQVEDEEGEYEMYLRIWGANVSIENSEGYNLEKYIPSSIIIGDNEGGMVIIYSTGKEGLGIYLTGYGDLDISDAIYIAPSLGDLLTRNVGIENLQG
ncbi:SMI1/KNR4 family protein [Priestia filamentosa]|uniref:SMI1/KNR4 family protein n=1 Tax=Priestia filamentosa TaxID=1402861 RepID=UPI003F144DEB